MQSITLEQAVRTAQQLKTGEALPSVMILNTEYFPRKAVKFTSGLSNKIENTELILPKHVKEVGVRNIDKDQLDYPFLPTGIRLVFDTTTADVTPNVADYKDNAPVYWANGEITIFQDGVLAELPVSVLANNFNPLTTTDDFFPLAPFLIRPNKSFKISTSLAGIAQAGHAYRIEILGIEFVKNSRN
ncbi:MULTISPECIES: hypothetical protein [Flavobacterium]|nr:MULTISPECIES: hypothetical protein [Flavobacterium]